MKTRKMNSSRAGANGQRPTGQKPPASRPPTARKSRRKPPFTLKQERSPGLRTLSFPEVAGKKAACVQMVTSDDYHSVYIVFEDNTAVGFEIEPCFTVQAFAGDIDGIDPGANKTWPEIRSERRSP